MQRIVITLMALSIFIACNTSVQTKILKPQSLPSQTFTVNTSKDTVLKTQNGALINIPKGALQANTATVQLEIKEAYHIGEMIKAGLLTVSNGNLLSSGGMIYVNAVGENTVKITQPIQISIPTNSINQNMQLFKGQEDENGNLNWVDPAPIPMKDAISALDSGKIIFQKKCNTCHGIERAITGPPLAHVAKIRDKKWLYAFTRNNQPFLKAGDRVATCLYNRYNKTPMNLFPELTDRDLDNLYSYIEHVSDSLKIPVPPTVTAACLDSCIAYFQRRAELGWKKDSLNFDNGPQVEEIPHNDSTGDAILNNPLALTLVEPIENEAIMYKFTIESFGWYNADMLLINGPGMIESNLSVRIQGQYRERINVYLVLPKMKVYAAAGLKQGAKDEYVFAAPNGKIYLPENDKGYVIVMGDREDDILFAQTEFYVRQKHQFNLTPALITPQQFNLKMQQLNIEQLSIRVEKSKNADEIKKTANELKDVDKLKPKGCDCNCGGTDSSSSPKASIAMRRNGFSSR